MIDAVDDKPERGLLLPLVAALRRIPSLMDQGTRNFVIRLLGNELREPLTIEDHPNPVVHLSNLAEACNQHPGRLSALLRVVGLLEQDSKPMGELRRLVSEMYALELFETEERARLFTLLAGVVVPDIADIYRAVAGDAAPGLRGPTTYVEVFSALENLNSRPDGIPRPLVFIEHVAAKVRTELGIELRRWVEVQARKLELVDELEAFREGLAGADPVGGSTATAPPRPGDTAYLVLMLRREGPTGDLFRLSHWRQLGFRGEWSPLPGGDKVDTLDGIKVHITALIEQTERDWARYSPDIKVEFVLDRENLNLDVDQWPAESDDFPEPVGCRYQTAVRSLERMADDKYLRVWRKRWTELTTRLGEHAPVPPDHSVRARDATTAGIRELMSVLSRRHDVVSLVLNTPPHPELAGHDEVAVGMKAGVPLVMWHRTDCTTTGFLDAVGYLLHDEDDRHPLLERVRRARTTAFAEGPGRHPCGGLTVLYDDPMRRVLPQHPTPPEEVSVG
ncbi:hypothetical protein FHS29_003389 [Saccharothrix tamanrassetensis]|uniref:Uncharacterized protein n=1 Tax=Saccharothrix tamanrassetensis TaxID=1051531 RepID=A0A841CML4_9PSEU|nr:hypothetical protein [Saccharothrix tamanrassetensis]MBB5956796.1 hypothetical protein [Saccharothrix tamanrassetensis]